MKNTNARPKTTALKDHSEAIGAIHGPSVRSRGCAAQIIRGEFRNTSAIAVRSVGANGPMLLGDCRLQRRSAAGEIMRELLSASGLPLAFIGNLRRVMYR